MSLPGLCCLLCDKQSRDAVTEGPTVRSEPASLTAWPLEGAGHLVEVTLAPRKQSTRLGLRDPLAVQSQIRPASGRDQRPARKNVPLSHTLLPKTRASLPSPAQVAAAERETVRRPAARGEAPHARLRSRLPPAQKCPALLGTGTGWSFPERPVPSGCAGSCRTPTEGFVPLAFLPCGSGRDPRARRGRAVHGLPRGQLTAEPHASRCEHDTERAAERWLASRAGWFESRRGRPRGRWGDIAKTGCPAAEQNAPPANHSPTREARRAVFAFVIQP